MKRMLLWSCVALAALLFYLARGDWMLSNLLSYGERTRFSTTQSGNADTDTAVMVFPPSQVSGETYTKAIRATLHTSGRFVIAAEYSQRTFNPRAIAGEAFEELKNRSIRKVHLVGASVGAKLVAEFIRYNQENDRHFEITGVTLLDPVMDAGDLHDSRSWVMRFLWWPGALANQFTSSFWNGSFNPPTPEEGADAELLAEHHRRSKNYQLSGWGGQIRAAAGSAAVQPGEFTGIPLRILRSKQDGVVKDSAVPKWLAAFNAVRAQVRYVDSAHCDVPAFPKAWNNALIWAGFHQ
jgi:hypothetical protein